MDNRIVNKGNAAKAGATAAGALVGLVVGGSKGMAAGAALGGGAAVVGPKLHDKYGRQNAGGGDGN